jgi:hypothetical protein
MIDKVHRESLRDTLVRVERITVDTWVVHESW